jgi:hypothetical protein
MNTLKNSIIILPRENLYPQIALTVYKTKLKIQIIRKINNNHLL